MHKDLPIDILSAVEKPARYTGMEFGSIVKPESEVEVSFALAFPDTYEIGMSYLGFKILYAILNKQPYIQAERVFAPWVDMEDKMRERGIALESLETSRRLGNFDLVGFTLLYEMSYSNILNMMDLGGVPIWAKDRGLDDPFVCAGGPCVFNSEPLADFLDFCMLGDGERIIVEVSDAYRAWKSEGKPGGRKEFLRRVARIQGVYVPSFYTVTYHADGTIKSVTPNEPGVPATVYKRVEPDINDLDFPTHPIVPYGDTVHDRIMLELFRGCSRGCRFCNAGIIYRPVRERTPENVKKLARELVPATGYNEMSMFSLSTADYSQLDPLVRDLLEEFKDDKVSVSLPSLRIDSFSVKLAQEVQAVRKSGLTFAPEAGSQRMRDVINKGLTEEVILNGAGQAFEGGWTKVKLYFMLGLPTETEDDMKEIAHLSEKVARRYYEIPKDQRHGKCQITASSSFFVPKPFTPFQWAGMYREEDFVEKAKVVKSEIRAQLNQRSIRYSWHEPDVTILEGFLARGDRRCSKVILRAYEKGAIYDAWSESFDYNIWKESFAETNTDIDFYTLRERSTDEILPWDFIDAGVTKKFLIHEWEQAKKETVTPNCRQKCSGCGVLKYKGGVCCESKN